MYSALGQLKCIRGLKSTFKHSVYVRSPTINGTAMEAGRLTAD